MFVMVGLPFVDGFARGLWGKRPFPPRISSQSTYSRSHNLHINHFSRYRPNARFSRVPFGCRLEAMLGGILTYFDAPVLSAYLPK
jgi:hypothetical protein